MGYTTQLPQEGKKNTESQRHEKKTKMIESYYKNGRLETREGGGCGIELPRRVRWVFSTRDLCS